MNRLGGPVHLARRLVWSLRPGHVDAAARARLLSAMSPPERALYERLADVDRRHAVSGVESVMADLGAQVGDDVIVAAALHDVGKVAADFGTFGRVIATIVAAAVGDRRLDRWAALGTDPADALDNATRGVRRRVGRYARHDVIGAAALRRAGSADLVVAWASGHHEPSAGPSDGATAAALRRADGA